MTVKILTAKRVTCTLCGARLEYEPDDVKSGTAHGRDYYNGVAMVDCPNGHTTPAHNRALTFDTRSPVTACHQTLTGEIIATYKGQPFYVGKADPFDDG